MAKGEVTCDVLLEIHREERLTIRVVSWNKRPPTLEKRGLYRGMNDQGEPTMLPGKAKGLTWKDLILIQEEWDKIAEIMDTGEKT